VPAGNLASDDMNKSMEVVRCEQCGATWHSPTAIATTVARDVALLSRSGDSLAAIRRLLEATGLELRDAKAVQLHVTRTPGKCQRCGAMLVGGGMTACAQCRSLNYDW
jgi:hypothetical protein